MLKINDLDKNTPAVVAIIVETTLLYSGTIKAMRRGVYSTVSFILVTCSSSGCKQSLCFHIHAPIVQPFLETIDR